MTTRQTKITRLLGAGSLATVAATLLMVPFNMGGCASNPTSGITNAVGAITSGTLPGGGGGQSNAASTGTGAGGILGTGIMSGNRTVETANAGLGLVQAFTLDDEKEDEMGQSVAVALSNRYGFVEDPGLTKYVRLVGLTITDASSRPDLPYVFGVLDSDEVGAYSGPKGYIFVTRGALKQMRDEAELAGVLAHEVSHVIRQHGFQAAKSAGAVDAASKLAATQSDQYAQLKTVTNGVVEQVLTKGYSQGQETSADQDAVGLTVAAGYDPAGYYRFLQRLGQTEGTGGSNPMSTHPGIGQRLQAVESQISRTGARGGATMAPRFQKNVTARL